MYLLPVVVEKHHTVSYLTVSYRWIHIVLYTAPITIVYRIKAMRIIFMAFSTSAFVDLHSGSLISYSNCLFLRRFEIPRVLPSWIKPGPAQSESTKATPSKHVMTSLSKELNPHSICKQDFLRMIRSESP